MAEDTFDGDIDSDPIDELGLDDVLNEIDEDGDSGLTKEDKEQLKKVTNNFIVNMGISAKIFGKILPRLREIMVKNRGVTVDYVKFLAEAISATQEELSPHLSEIYRNDAKRERLKLVALMAQGFSREEAMALLLKGFGDASLGIPSLPFQVTRTPRG